MHSNPGPTASPPSLSAKHIVVRQLGLQAYKPIWQAMKNFTQGRDHHSADEIWLLQHYPVFTQGQAGKAEHILNLGDIPLVQTDRGGKITYHGPGQLIVYLMLDLKRLGLGPKKVVTLIEDSIRACLQQLSIQSHLIHGAPGVFVQQKKIASLGLRVRKGCSFHGLSLNVDMDLEPFSRINPCGYQGLQMCQIAALRHQHQLSAVPLEDVAENLLQEIKANLGYTTVSYCDELNARYLTQNH